MELTNTRFDPYWTDLTRVWPLMTPIDLEKYWIWILENISSRNICIFDIFRPTGPIWPLLDGFDPSLTFDDPDWPWKILNLNSWENFESKHMYIGYISTNPPDLTLIRRFWPLFLTKNGQIAKKWLSSIQIWNHLIEPVRTMCICSMFRAN